MARVNWHQAGAEVGLLLVGVALAFGADSWRDSRTDRLEEVEYLRALQADLTATQTRWDQSVRAAQDQQEHNRRLIALLNNDPGAVPVDSIVEMIQPAFLYLGPTAVMATYHDMVNSGDLRLIRSDSLRYELALFAADLEYVAEINREEHALVSQSVFPFLREAGLLINSYRELPNYGLMDVAATSPQGSPGEWGQELQGMVASKSLYARTIEILYTAGGQSLARILPIIEEELAR